MSDALAAVSRTLAARLTAGLAVLGGPALPAPVARPHDLVEQISKDPPTLTVFLYDVVEDPTVRNRPATSRVVGGEHRLRKPPLGLVLHYMITAWGGTRDTELQMLGVAMQTLHDDAIIDGPDLVGFPPASPVQLKVTLAPLFLDDRARIWFAIGQPYRLSVNYEVRVVEIAATTEDGAGIARERIVDAGIPVGVR